MRERVGDEEFAGLLKGALATVKAERDWPEVELSEGEDWCEAIEVMTFPNGDLWPDTAEALGELAGREGFHVRIAGHHRMLAFGPDKPALRQAIDQLEALAEPRRPQPAVVACPGKRWCKRAIVDTNQIADKIRAELSDELSPETTVCISGCPNGCAHSAVADIGLIGQVATIEGQRTEAYRLLAGGGMGRNAKLAKLVAQGLTADEVIERATRIARR